MNQDKSCCNMRDVGLLIIRVGLGICFMIHGWPKITGGSQMWNGLGHVMPFGPATMWGFVGALIEFGGGLLLALGFLSRPVSFLLFLQMMIATFMFHMAHGDSFNVYSHALEDGIVFLGLALTGAGACSIDAKMGCCRKDSPDTSSTSP